MNLLQRTIVATLSNKTAMQAITETTWETVTEMVNKDPRNKGRKYTVEQVIEASKTNDKVAERAAKLTAIGVETIAKEAIKTRLN